MRGSSLYEPQRREIPLAGRRTDVKGNLWCKRPTDRPDAVLIVMTLAASRESEATKYTVLVKEHLLWRGGRERRQPNKPSYPLSPKGIYGVGGLMPKNK